MKPQLDWLKSHADLYQKYNIYATPRRLDQCTEMCHHTHTTMGMEAVELCQPKLVKSYMLLMMQDITGKKMPEEDHD